MIVTTARRRAKQLEARAEHVALELDVIYKQRNDRSVSELMKEWDDDVLVAGSDRLSLFQKGSNDPFFYHPNAASFRAKAFMAGKEDPFIEATELQLGSSILDCTLGLAADAVLAKLAVGDTGNVTGVEAQPVIAYIVKQGLQEWQDAPEYMLMAMRSIEVRCGHHLDILKKEQDNAFDVVYFDPMFEADISQSEGIRPLKQFASYEDLSDEVLKEARRVAKKRVVLKDHWQSNRFDRWGFHVKKKRPARFYYGIIETKQM